MTVFYVLLEALALRLEIAPIQLANKALIFNRVQLDTFSVSEFCEGLDNNPKNDVHNEDSYQYVKAEIEEKSGDIVVAVLVHRDQGLSDPPTCSQAIKCRSYEALPQSATVVLIDTEFLILVILWEIRECYKRVYID